MANPIKKLAGQTAIYGLSSIVGRFLNYLLVPLHTAKFSTDQYGVITEMYAYVAFLIILLTYGMETAYFRFSNKSEESEDQVFGVVIKSIISSSLLFIAVCTLFRIPIADWLRYPDHSEYVVWFALIVGFDAISSIPLARLRSKQRPMKFAMVNLANVFTNIGLNLFFIGYCKSAFEAGQSNIIVDSLYSPEIGVGYVFISNLIASIVKLLLLSPIIVGIRSSFDGALLKKLVIYSLPLLFAGLAGMVNETIDRILLKYLLFDSLGEKATMSQLGIYGACYKVSIIITLFIQAFRYAAEPFFFSHAKTSNSKQTYASVMNYFVGVCSTIFLGVLLFIDLIKYFIPNPEFWVGLKVVPVLLMANICLGIYFNQSIWYKMTDKTQFGAYIAIGGAILTVILNVILIPTLGYMGSAWATLIVYASMVLASYTLGQIHFPIPYNLIRVFSYIGSSLVIYFLGIFLQQSFPALHWIIALIGLSSFISIVYLTERRDISKSIESL